ncbi:MAG: XdhC family protein [Acholeplasmataceae bacterium]
MNDIHERIAALKKEGVDTVLVTAVEKSGEGPVEVGKKMLVTTRMSYGTVGGGALEHYAMSKARELLKERTHAFERYALNENEAIPGAKTLPMACGGTVALFYEFIGVKAFVTIFGAGHVGQALVDALFPLDFHVTVIDDRKSVLAEVTGADQKHLSPFATYIERHGIATGSYVIVCTPSHDYDYHVLNRILAGEYKPKYVGMLCSPTKLKSYLERTKKDFPDADLSDFYAPIGLDLGGGSPAEIAVAIVAEMLSVHYDRKGHRHLREVSTW